MQGGTKVPPSLAKACDHAGAAVGLWLDKLAGEWRSYRGQLMAARMFLRCHIAPSQS